MAFATIAEALEDIKQGKIIIVADDEDRENEGDLVMAASWATPAAINFMAKYGRGIICCPITSEKARQFQLDLMASSNSSQYETAFTVSVDAIKGGTGISAQDRSLTIKTLVDDQLGPEHLARPGHVFPLIARTGGVLRRAGHTEAAVDLAHLAGLPPVGVICEIMNDDGTMARIPDLELFAQQFQLKMITIKDLIAYRGKNELLVKEATAISFPNQFGNFQLHLFESIINPHEHHLALVKGDLAAGPVLVRVHSECLTGDVFGSLRCDCGAQLQLAMEEIEKAGQGVLLYMRQEGRGIGLPNKIRAYQFQDQGHDTVDANRCLGFQADLRDYGIGAQILRLLGAKEIRLMTNNPKKIIGLEGHGLKVVERIPIEIPANGVNAFYLQTKQKRLGHLLGGQSLNNKSSK